METKLEAYCDGVPGPFIVNFGAEGEDTAEIVVKCHPSMQEQVCRHIVNACNNYQALVEAAKDCLNSDDLSNSIQNLARVLKDAGEI